jgi:hypothetical protein
MLAFALGRGRVGENKSSITLAFVLFDKFI